MGGFSIMFIALETNDNQIQSCQSGMFDATEHDACDGCSVGYLIGMV
jgi:hypothetical protein